MSTKAKNRKKYDAKSALVIKELALRYKVSEAFVRLAINGDRVSETAEQIKREYGRLLKELKEALSSK